MSMLIPVRVPVAASPIEMKSSVSAHDKKTVMTKFIIAGLRMDQAGTTVPLIHWRAAFAYHRGGRDSSHLDWKSVTFDTLKNTDTGQFFVQVRGVPGITSTRMAIYWNIDIPNPRYTLQQLFDIVDQQQYFNHFLFNGGGSGCRTWTIAFTNFFERINVLSPGTTQWVINQITGYQLTNGPSVYIPQEIGATFYRFVLHRDGTWGTYEDKQYIPAGFMY